MEKTRQCIYIQQETYANHTDLDEIIMLQKSYGFFYNIC
jgi:hypothetical protein